MNKLVVKCGVETPKTDPVVEIEVTCKQFEWGMKVCFGGEFAISIANTGEVWVYPGMEKLGTKPASITCVWPRNCIT